MSGHGLREAVRAAVACGSCGVLAGQPCVAYKPGRHGPASGQPIRDVHAGRLAAYHAAAATHLVTGQPDGDLPPGQWQDAALLAGWLAAWSVTGSLAILLATRPGGWPVITGSLAAVLALALAGIRAGVTTRRRRGV